MTETTLRKEIKPRQLLTFFAGTMIGAGWMVIVGVWVQQAGVTGAAIAFILGTLCIAVIALPYLELSLMFPYSGGEVVYAYEAYGVGGALFTAWPLALMYVAYAAFDAVVIGWLVTLMIPQLGGPVLYEVAGYQITVGALAVGMTGTIILAWVNCRGGGSAARLQEILTWTLLTGVVFILGYGLVQGISSDIELTLPTGRADWLSILALWATVPAWFAGFAITVQTFGELTSLKNSRGLVSLTFIPVIGLGVFYVLAILSIGLSASPEALKAAEFAPLALFDNSPISRTFVLLVALLGLVTSWNTAIFSGSRIIFALGRARIIPQFFGSVHKRYQSPHVAVLFITTITFLSSLLGRVAIGIVVNVAAISMVVVYFVLPFALMKLRRVSPDATRPYRIPFYPFSPILAIIISVIFAIAMTYTTWTEYESGTFPKEWITLAIWAFLGVVFWFTASPIRNKISETERQKLIQSR